ncbi:AraC family transcriptional regulator [Paenibacillus sp. CGMCC 1.16610]|uniref:Helix-turn-helix domain-containing protein n=1 Tax=Paenibacillus anseongense TaxID=2682845 RepID=A0ABW9UG62_9BACL|nr:MULTISPECIES: AraC family transcriptional regulator [Paenibacillus]MBA2944112.1 AraC family transcriptional regulator [Paenibacillus sp. CGMCC 1.16610]MVQ38001.1 helix-turn-helix domain-containing protein [Paenibacillus anseongense]
MSQPFYFEPMLENPTALDRLDLRFRWGSYGIRVLRCHLTSFPAGTVIDFHHHSEFEFHYIPSGKGKVILDGVTHPLQEGMLYVTAPGVLHRQEADEHEKMDELCLHVDFVRLEGSPLDGDAGIESQAWGEAWEIAEADACIKQLSELPQLPAFDRQEAMKCFLVAFEAWRDNQLGQYTIIKQSIIQMLLRTIGAYKADHQGLDLPARDMKSYRYQLAVQFIEDNFRRPLTLEGVAERLQISSRQLQRIFKEQANISFSEYLEQVRLKHVCTELLQTTMTLEKIAEKSGFASSNYLHYVFKKAHGVTPNRYRERLHG